MTRFRFPLITRFTTFHQLFIVPFWTCENRYSADEAAFSTKEYLK